MATRSPSPTDDRVQTPRLGLLTVGETARILGVCPSTLRLWENVGLISPARSHGRYRLYSPELLDVLKRIKYLRDVKFLNLPGIRQALGDGGDGEGAPRRPSRQARTQASDLRMFHGLGVVEAPGARDFAGSSAPSSCHSANPSVATLQRLAATYGTTVGVLRHAQACETAVRPRERRAIQLVSASASKSCRSAPGSWRASSDDSAGHRQRRRLLPPGEEFIFMVQGTLELWLDELECHTLRGRQFLSRALVGIAGLTRRTSRRDLGSRRRRRSSRRHSTPSTAHHDCPCRPMATFIVDAADSLATGGQRFDERSRREQHFVGQAHVPAVRNARTCAGAFALSSAWTMSSAC